MSAPFRTAAIIGAGTIGLSWTALFAAHGLDVRVTDPRPDLAEAVRDALTAAAPALAAQGLDTDRLHERVRLVVDLTEAVYGADVIQESGPENEEFKARTAAQALSAAPSHAIFLSSTSQIPAGVFTKSLEHADRILVAHPLNPPYGMPLVEVVPGERTSQAAVDRAVEFYRSVGRTPVVEHKEVRGFVATELQNVLARRAAELVLDGVVSPAELDLIVRSSLGLRWAALGPFLGLHLGGGPAGYRGLLAVGAPGIPDEERPVMLREKVVQLVEDTYGLSRYSGYTAARDRRQQEILDAIAGAPLPHPSND
ncbi:3-hydroxyacyl-CoA dehydrogenase NAD-binding domain-containing protein [Streptomyces sp. 3214.6]|uniref:3-hydroxyacyl-CoA dehydrogenase NAD-binding domain-containing protein n=1 Tax=Streptomyces sp. 3214.6 TaxID=1882757 RepID=UPI00090A8D3B|nr:3-hydroxyacyl-CoA dehydrogenase NAD-binding domain-containing protein [Streptomyces sp. 3214.6]SHH30992.1 ketoreductase RED1 [Streptomyces sp. 3214.6]